MKIIVITDIHSSLSDKKVRAIAQKRSHFFKKVHGLEIKYWTKDKKGTYHGIFIFKNRKTAQKYLKTSFAKSVAKAYHTTKPVKVSIYETFDTLKRK